jgi:hypothetical protein
MMRTLSSANAVKMNRGAGGCQDQQNNAKVFQPRLHSQPFVLGVFGNQVEPVQIALT